MMAEYIDKEAVKEIMQKYRCSDCTNDKSLDCPLCQLRRPFAEISKIPTADVQEIRHGRWISNDLGGYKWAYYCSECGWVDGYPFNDRHKYCPNCGAKMKGGDGDG